MPISPSVGSFRRAGRLCPRDLAVALRSTVSGELPYSARLLDFVQIQVDDQELASLPSSVPDERAGRTRDAALAVKLADTPRLFVTHAMDRSYEILIGDGACRLFELPQVFGKSRDRG